MDTIDPRDVIYTVVGLALFGLTLQPALARYRLFNLPLLYVVIGACLGTTGFALINPLEGGWQLAVIEHASELIVIISLAGAGLAIDTVGTWRNWAPTWRLLAAPTWTSCSKPTTGRGTVEASTIPLPSFCTS